MCYLLVKDNCKYRIKIIRINFLCNNAGYSVYLVWRTRVHVNVVDDKTRQRTFNREWQLIVIWTKLVFSFKFCFPSIFRRETQFYLNSLLIHSKYEQCKLFCSYVIINVNFHYFKWKYVLWFVIVIKYSFHATCILTLQTHWLFYLKYFKET